MVWSSEASDQKCVVDDRSRLSSRTALQMSNVKFRSSKIAPPGDKRTPRVDRRPFFVDLAMNISCRVMQLSSFPIYLSEQLCAQAASRFC